MPLPLVYYGNPILRKKAKPVAQVNEEVKRFIDNMIHAMHHYNGSGIAANQLGSELAIFIAHIPLRNEHGQFYADAEGRACRFEERVYINPEILSVSEDNWVYNEGCLSIPKLYEDVERPYSVRVRALNRHGQPFEETLSDYEGRIIFHENDHLNGVLFIDRLPRKRRREIEPQLARIKKTYNRR